MTERDLEREIYLKEMEERKQERAMKLARAKANEVWLNYLEAVLQFSIGASICVNITYTIARVFITALVGNTAIWSWNFLAYHSIPMAFFTFCLFTLTAYIESVKQYNLELKRQGVLK